jgi:cytoskeletal protein RodZ
MNTRIPTVASILLLTALLAVVGVSSAYRSPPPSTPPSALPERAANLPAADRPTLAPPLARLAAAPPVSSITLVTATAEIAPAAPKTPAAKAAVKPEVNCQPSGCQYYYRRGWLRRR